MSQELIIQLDKEIAVTAARLDALRAARTSLSGVVPVKIAPGAATSTPTPKKPAKANERAPVGFLEDAMAKAIVAKPGMDSGEIREALAAARYPYSISPLHVTKRLTKGIGKRWKMKEDGNTRRFYPVK
jgi:hypothetical protein